MLRPHEPGITESDGEREGKRESGGERVLRASVPLPAVPLLAMWRQQAVGLQRSVISGDYPHLAPGVGVKALLRLVGSPFFSFRSSHTFSLTIISTHQHNHCTHPRIFKLPRLFCWIYPFV